MDGVINLRKGIVRELEEQAKENNRSLEAEMKAILDEWAERSAARSRFAAIGRRRVSKE
jgi:plasmid stability protein